MPTQPALLGTARLNNARLGYVPTAIASVRRTKINVLLAGVLARVRADGLTINDVLGAPPSTCDLVIDAANAPTAAQSVRITIGVDAPRLLFSGTLQTADLTYEGASKANDVWPCTAIDYTARANRRRPFGTWVSVSATTIAQYITAVFAPGFTSTYIAAGLPLVSIVFDGSADFIGCLSQLATAIGGYCKIDDLDVYLFQADTTDAPDPIDVAHPFLNEPPITCNQDVSQLRTRVYGKGHGEQVIGDVLEGETILPIENAVMFGTMPGGGGRILAGTTPDGAQSQIVDYTGVQPGGSGSQVGPGASPSARLMVAIASGAGLGAGLYQWAYSLVTPSGESLPSPLASLVVGTTAPPIAAPHVGAPTVGTGPNPGSHSYAVTFVTASGETTPGPLATRATDLLPDPVTAPVIDYASILQWGSGVDIGNHDYRVSFVTAIGETLPGPVSYSVATSAYLSAPTNPYFGGAALGWSNVWGPALNLSAGVYQWAMTWVLPGGGETTPSPIFSKTMGANSAITLSILATTLPYALATVASLKIYRTVANGSQLKYVGTVGAMSTTFYDNVGDGSLGANAPTVNTAYAQRVALYNLPVGDASVTSRKLYRRFNSSGTFKLVVSLPPTGTTYLDTTPNAALTTAAPSVSTAYVQRFALDSIPTGDALVTARRIYRTAAGGVQLKLAATIADNVTTVWSDSVDDASLGANVPTSNTATANRANLSGISIGASPTTSRKVYRTIVNGTQLKLLTTIANNTTTVFADSTADGALGANAPTSDTSGLTQPVGQVNAGSTAIPTASAGPFPSSGWALLAGNQAIRYTGISGNSLTGIPASGPGAILTTVLYGSQILPSPALTGLAAKVRLAAPIAAMPCTFVARVKLRRQSIGLGNVLSLVNATTSVGFYLWINSVGKVDAQEYTGASSLAETALGVTPGVWATVGGTFDGVTTYAYLDGVRSAGVAATPTPPTIDTLFIARQVGLLFGTTPIDGEMVDAAVYDSALSAADMATIAAGASPSTVQAGHLVYFDALPLVGGLRLPMQKGAPVHIWVQRDDLAAQATQAALDLANGVTPADGIYEGPVISDERRGEASLIALCDANLQLFARPIVTFRYATRDLKTKSGKTVHINVPGYPVGDYVIQEVTITELDVPAVGPRFTVTASTVRFSLDDILRKLLTAQAA